MRKNHTKQERLHSRADINRIFRNGKAVSTYGARLLFVPNGLSCNRVVFIPAKKFGNAVERNRVRRHAREIFRLEKERFKGGCDIAVIFYPGMKYDYWKRKEQILHLFTKAGLLRTHTAIN